MLLWLLDHLTVRPGLAAWEKITPRAALAAGLSFAVAVLLGPRWIGWLRRGFREPIKSDSPEIVRLHRDKQATPTMGGLLIIAPAGIGTHVWRSGQRLSGGGLLAAGGLTLVGMVDDLVRFATPQRTFRPAQNFLDQLVVAAAVAPVAL